MTETAKSGDTARPGWYPHPQMVDTVRYWDGKAWTNNIARKESPTGGTAGVVDKPEAPASLIVGGFIVAVIGMAMLLAFTDTEAWFLELAGLALLSIGGIMSMIGVIAAGVRLGIRHGDWERQERAGS